MVVVRESPHAKLSPSKNDAQWPPKSPFQALLFSPSGRRKWQDRHSRSEERSPSPSPMRKSVASSRQLQSLGMTEDGDDEDEEDEDEETLQLRLQQIEAKLKLKRLQKAKQSASAPKDAESNAADSVVRASSPRKTAPLSETQTRRSQQHVEVPLSPVRRERPLQEQLSPARAKLGLATSMRAQDVSLKRPRDGAFAKHRELQASAGNKQAGRDTPRPKSFGERLVEKEHKAQQLEAKRQRLESIRSSNFGQPAANASSIQPRQIPPNESLRGSHSAERLRIERTRNLDQKLARSASARSRRREEYGQIPAKGLFQHQEGERPKFDTGGGSSDSGEGVEIDTLDGAPGYDPFSQIHLSKRNMPHTVVAREMTGKEIYTLPRLLKEVKSPEYEPPDCESDYVVFAILASKSNPFDQVTTHRQTNGQTPDNLEAPRNKFMVLHLCDLKWEVDLFLFGTAFNQFWKLTPGTLLAILNPAIMPPKGNQHNGRFSLKLGSSEDAVMEIGAARDLGYCVSVKRDGQQCSEWVDKRKTEACEFHVNLQVEKSRKNRIEVNSSWNGTGPENQHKSKSRKGTEGQTNSNRGGKYHREYGQLYSVNSGIGKSAAILLDADDAVALDGMTQEEASRKRLAAAQRERDLAKKLGEMGKGMGAEYLRATQQSSALAISDENANLEREVFFPPKPSAASLGLLSNRAGDARLSPAKDRKRHFGLGALNMRTGGTEAMGWGGARKAGLLQPKDRSNTLGSPERGQTRLETASVTRAGSVRPRSQDGSTRSTASPQKKKARFALEKGIREPGRESLPGATDTGTNGIAGGALDGEDEDDDLDIV